MRKSLKYYEKILNVIVPADLLPVINSQSNEHDHLFYYELLKNIYSSLTYRKSLKREEIIKSVLLVYSSLNPKEFIGLSPQSLLPIYLLEKYVLELGDSKELYTDFIKVFINDVHIPNIRS